MIKKSNRINAKILSFEGIEGCGKSTQINLLKKYLDENNISYSCFREPGGTDCSEAIRNVLLDRNFEKDTLTQVFLFMAARRQLYVEKIRPLLSKNTLIILDRYIDSTLVYQAMANDLDWEYILELHQNLDIFFMPHKTIYLGIDYETSCERLTKRDQEADYFELKPKRFFTKIINSYEYLSKRYPVRYEMVNGSYEQNRIHEMIKKITNDLLDLH